jgi:dTDP-glucose 4,6-dehydratase
MESMNILITGAAGFIGSAVTNALVEKYPQAFIVGLDKLSYCSSLNNLSVSMDKKNFKFIEGDICACDLLKFIFKEYQINIIMHFAAYSHVDHSFGNSLIFTQNNVIGTHTLLEVSKLFKSQIVKFIHVSTDEVYGDNDGISTENTMMNPTNPYAASKAAAECFVLSYYHSFSLPIIITRGNNVYGPMQYPEKAIPRFCLRLLKGLKCEIQGSGKQTRSFLHINDVVDAFDMILNKGVIGTIYNIGSNDDIAIANVVHTLIAKIYPELSSEKAKELVSFVRDRDFNDTRYVIDKSKLSSLGWTQKISFEDGLQQTIDWYREHQNYWDNDSLQSALYHHSRNIS